MQRRRNSWEWSAATDKPGSRQESTMPVASEEITTVLADELADDHMEDNDQEPVLDDW